MSTNSSRILFLSSNGKQNRSMMSQGPDFDDNSRFFPSEIDDAIQYINLGYETQAPKVVIL